MATTPAARFLLPGILLLALLAPAVAGAQEVSRGAQPTPDNVGELGGALQEAFEEEEVEVGWFPGLTRSLRKLPPFLSDTKLSFYARTYYWDEHRTDETRAQAWALGGALSYRSGWLKDIFAIGASVYTSQRLVGKRRRDGTGLLRTGQKGYTVAGQAWAEFRFRENHSLKVYRQVVDLPYVNKADTRMTPNTFEAYMVRGSFDAVPRLGQVNYAAGWIDKIRKRDKKSFVSMSEATGVPASNDGMATATLRIRPNESFSVGMTNHFVNDTFNTFYAESSWVHELTEEWGLRLEGQFTHQASVGDERSPGSPFATWHGSLRVASSYRGFIGTLAGSATGNGAEVRKPWGLSPAYLGLMQSDFDRAGEDAWLIGVSYDFAGVGLTGFSAFANFAVGHDARDTQSTDRFSDQREVDLTLDYRFQKGWLRGLWLRARGSFRSVEGTERNSTQIRIIANYEIPIL